MALASGWDIRFAELLHGTMDVPQHPQKLSGDIWGLSAIFFGEENEELRLRNFCKFRTWSKKQGLKLLMVEQALPGREFLLTPGDADILIQIRGGDILWQKERLLSYGLGKLPKECDKVISLDTDILFLNEHWIKETARLLEKYEVVQPFKGVFTSGLEQSEEILAASHEQVTSGRYMRPTPSAGYRMSLKRFGLWPRQANILVGHPGCAIAFRRSVLDDIGFYEKMVIGSGDRVMMQSLYRVFDEKLYREMPEYYDQFSPERYKDLPVWSQKMFARVQRSVYFTEGILLHLWHGDIRKRKYDSRHHILVQYGYDSATDIKLDKSGCWVWATDKKEMHQAVKEYFQSRI